MRRDVTTELKELRLHGMVGAWTDLMAQGESGVASSKWLIDASVVSPTESLLRFCKKTPIHL